MLKLKNYMSNIKINSLIQEIDKKINNLDYRIEGALQRKRIQNIKIDYNLNNLISMRDLLIEIRSELLLKIQEDKIVYDFSYLRKIFVNLRIFK